MSQEVSNRCKLVYFSVQHISFSSPKKKVNIESSKRAYNHNEEMIIYVCVYMLTIKKNLSFININIEEEEIVCKCEGQ
jgi:hypothetical protein